MRIKSSDMIRPDLPVFVLRVPGSPSCPALYACSWCHALVLDGDIDGHEAWHTEGDGRRRG